MNETRLSKHIMRKWTGEEDQKKRIRKN